jgi:hypothetical protein
MNQQPLRPRASGLLSRHPLLRTEWLALANTWIRWRRERAHSYALVITISLLVLALTAVVLAIFASRASVAIVLLADYWVLTTAATAAYAAMSMAKRRRRIHDSQVQSWLVATPIAAASVRWSGAVRSVAPLIAQFLTVVVLVLALQWLSGGINAATGITIAAIGAGALIGAAIGWRVRAEAKSWLEASRYVPRTKPHDALRPDSAALSSWPILQVLAWSRPENSRYVLIVALFAVQGGSSAIAGLSVVAAYFLASYLTALVSAVLQVSKAAGAWLRSTPMSLSEFVWTLARRVLVHQILGTTLAAALMLLLGVPLSMALQLAALWLALVISLSGWSLVDNYRGRSPTIKLALSLATFAALAALWQMRAGAKA